MKTNLINQSKDHSQSLRQATPLLRAIRGNGIFSGTSGLIALIGAKPLASFMGVDAPIVFVGLGIMLLSFAATLFWVAAQPEVDRKLGYTAVILDIGWVVSSIAILLTGMAPPNSRRYVDSSPAG